MTLEHKKRIEENIHGTKGEFFTILQILNNKGKTAGKPFVLKCSFPEPTH